MPEIYKYIDLTYLKDFSNGDKKFMKEIILISIEQTDSELIHLKNTLTEKKYAEIGKICHKLRSSMGFMGISQALIEDLKELEVLPPNQSEIFETRSAHVIKICAGINEELRMELHRLENEN